MNIFFNFYGSHVSVSTDSEEVLERLAKDFEFFRIDAGVDKFDFSIKVCLGNIPWEKLPALVAKGQSKNSMTYQAGSIRYNNYYGEALSIYNYAKQTAEVYADNIDRIHEVTYLLILSRTGKRMDKKGLHKIHAAGISYAGYDVIVMCPMKGGKSTLLMNLIRNSGVSLYSDDSPLINMKGEIQPFPLRIGLSKKPEGLNDTEYYVLNRKEFGKKFLIPISSLATKVALPSLRASILVVGVRANISGCELKPVSRIRMLPELIKNMVVGIGLPLIVEYFFEHTWRDRFYNLSIGIKRLLSSLVLLARSKCYVFIMGNNPDYNSVELIEMLDNLGKHRQKLTPMHETSG